MEMPEFIFTCEQDLSGVALIPYSVMFAVSKIQILLVRDGRVSFFTCEQELRLGEWLGSRSIFSPVLQGTEFILWSAIFT